MTATTILPDIHRSVAVSWTPAEAFRRFTEDFGRWWPRATHSIGGPLVRQIVFECRVGGLIYEELADGRRFQWGRVTAFDPPRQVSFTWHPSRDADEAQDVTLTFAAEGSSTRVRLVSSGWHRFGPEKRTMHRAYDIGWGSVLDTFAGRRGAAMVLFGVLAAVVTGWRRLTGTTEAAIARAGGRLPT